MNKVFLTGNLTKDPELSTVGANKSSVCKFGLAVNRRVNGSQETDFYNITVWRALGENCAKYLKKGSKIAVCGDISTRTYNEKLYIDVNATDIEFLNTKSQEQPTSSYDKRNDIEMKPIADDSLPF